MASFDREQLKLTRAIQREARSRYKNPKLRKRRVLTALSVGLVESGMHNLKGGDQDSVNFRQERTSIYGGDMNVSRIAARLFDEMDQHDRGQSKGELAADVQRPREDLRGKYGLRMGDARQLRRAAGGGGSSASSGGSGRYKLTGRRGEVTPGTRPTMTLGGTTVDKKGALVAALLDGGRGSLLKRWQGEIATGKYTTTTKPKVTPGKPAKYEVGDKLTVTGGRPAAREAAKGGTATFEGKTVMAKFLPELRWARAHGWKGTVTSGVRTKAQQMAAARSFGLQHYGPAGPLGSNHVEGHRGAVDVTDPDSLERVLRKYGGRRYLRRGMADDPVHFSPTGH